MKILKGIAFASITALMLSACGGNSNSGDAVVGEEQEAAEAGVSSVRFAANDESKVTWIGSKPTGKHNGMIPVTEGELFIENGTITSGSFTMNIKGLEVLDLENDPNKEDDMNDKLTGHLMSEDFFAADSFPTASFEITEVKAFDAETMKVEGKEQFETEFKPANAEEFMIENPTHWVSGNLTMRGTTKNIAFPASVSVEGDKVTAEAKFNIDRTDWGLMYGDEASVADKAKDKFIYNTVNVGINLVATQAGDVAAAQ
ncbi:YceI family protein [Marinigracilibium pacificum]|uniref:YceI family protein n=1 Tax=Marinigracilibium pacificum TaxID=2729599 RepID=A0A848J0F5_9BACT|nr:YceI family protein [Marinigracilibium pacificum]NMM49316.1 YceI family protein [Marinigracilibium pacificum]